MRTCYSIMIGNAPSFQIIWFVRIIVATSTEWLVNMSLLLLACVLIEVSSDWSIERIIERQFRKERERKAHRLCECVFIFEKDVAVYIFVYWQRKQVRTAESLKFTIIWLDTTIYRGEVDGWHARGNSLPLSFSFCLTLSALGVRCTLSFAPYRLIYAHIASLPSLFRCWGKDRQTDRRTGKGLAHTYTYILSPHIHTHTYNWKYSPSNGEEELAECCQRLNRSHHTEASRHREKGSQKGEAFSTVRVQNCLLLSLASALSLSSLFPRESSFVTWRYFYSCCCCWRGSEIKVCETQYILTCAKQQPSAIRKCSAHSISPLLSSASKLVVVVVQRTLQFIPLSGYAHPLAFSAVGNWMHSVCFGVQHLRVVVYVEDKLR